MRTNYWLCIVMLVFCCVTAADAKKKDNPFNYEISCAGSGTQGYSLVRVKAFVDSKKEIGEDVLKRCAVHGVLFRGYGGGQGCVSQPPLAGSAMVEQQYSDFFQPFFQRGGGYDTYCSVVDGSMQTVKQGKQYVVIGVVNVAKSQLRKDLEQAGVVKKLSSGF